MQHVLLGVDLLAREVAGVAPRRRASRSLVAGPEEAGEKTSAHGGPPSGALITRVALFPRVNLHASREPVRLEPLPGSVLPPQRGVPGAPPAKLGQRLGRGRHQRLEEEHDVAHHRHLGVVVTELPALAGEVEREFVGIHRKAHLQAHLRQEPRVPRAEIRRFLPPEHHVVICHRLLDPVEVVQHLRQPPRSLGAVEAEVLRLHPERSHLEPERRDRSVRVAAVVKAEGRGMVVHPETQNRIRRRRKGREGEESGRVERPRRGHGQRRRAELQEQKPETPQKLRLGLVSDRLGRPEALRATPGMRQRERSREDAAEEVR